MYELKPLKPEKDRTIGGHSSAREATPTGQLLITVWFVSSTALPTPGVPREVRRLLGFPEVFSMVHAWRLFS